MAGEGTAETATVEAPPEGQKVEIDFEDPAVQKLINEKAQESKDFFDRSKTEYEEARDEHDAMRQQLEKEQREAPPPKQPDSGPSLQDFYNGLQKDMEDSGKDPAQAKADTQSILRANHEVMKFAREAFAEQEVRFEKKLSEARGELSTYREGRAFQDLAHENPTIAGYEYKDLQRMPSVMSEAERIRTKEFPGMPPRPALEMAVGRKRQELATIDDEKRRADAAEGLPGGGNAITSERLSKVVTGKDLRGKSLEQRTELYRQAIESMSG